MGRTSTTASRRGPLAVADDYLNLIRRFPLRPIRTAAEYASATRVLKDLVGRADAGVTRDEQDYTDVLSRLVRDYDERNSSLLKSRAAGRRGSPLEMLKCLMEEHGMNTSALGQLVGGSGQASLILHGKRELSKANIRALADRFKVSAGLFL